MPMFVILFSIIDPQDKANLVHNQQAHGRDEYLRHEWCMHHLDHSNV